MPTRAFAPSVRDSLLLLAVARQSSIPESFAGDLWSQRVCSPTIFDPIGSVPQPTYRIATCMPELAGSRALIFRSDIGWSLEVVEIDRIIRHPRLTSPTLVHWKRHDGGRPSSLSVVRGPPSTLRSTNPLRRDRLRTLVCNEFSAASLLLGADRSRILPELRPHGHGLFDSRPLADFFQPALYIWELVDFDLPARPARGPGIADHIGNRILAGREIALFEQTEIHHAEDAMRFIIKAALRVGEIAVVSGFGGASEMSLLPELGTLIGQLPADPLSDIVFAARILRVEPSGLLSEIHHDRPGFENRHRGAAAHRLVVDYRGHPAVRRNLQKFGSELVPAADIDRFDRVREPQLLEKNYNLLAVSGP